MKSVGNIAQKLSRLFESGASEDRKVCAVCQSTSSPESKFCDFCGSPLAVMEATRAPSSEIITAFHSGALGSSQNQDRLVVLEISSVYESVPSKSVLTAITKGVEKAIEAKMIAEKLAPKLYAKNHGELDLDHLMSPFLGEAFDAISRQSDQQAVWGNMGLLTSVIHGKRFVAVCIGSVKILIVSKEGVKAFSGQLSKEELKLYNEQLLTGDYVLQCSSELTDSLREREIQNAVVGVKKPQQICDHLIALARNRGVKKDLPIVVTQVI
jgi:hypothetical protein